MASVGDLQMTISAVRRAKLVMYRASRDLGLIERVADSDWRARRLAILCYHGVSLADEHEWNPELYVSPHRLRERFELLVRGGYNVLRLDEAVTRLYRGDLPPRSVVLTFDDGYYDFYARALPLLREYEFPATVYLSTYYCDDNRPIFDVMCSYLFWKARGRVVRIRGLAGVEGTIDLREAGSSEPWAARAREAAAKDGLSASAKHEALVSLAEQLHVDLQSIMSSRILHLMQPHEVALAAEQGADIQLHTHRHRVPLERDLFAREILENRERIERMSRKRAEVVHFCYPSGDHSPRFFPWLRELGITSATTCDTGLATPQTHALLMPRIVDTSTLSPLEFDAWISGVAALVPRRTATVSRLR